MVETQQFDREDNGYFEFTGEIFKSVRDFLSASLCNGRVYDCRAGATLDHR